jgi:hypothetical protein
MNYAILTNAILFATLFVVLWKVRSIQIYQRNMYQSLLTIANSLNTVIRYAESCDRIEKNTIDALNQICKALTEYFKTGDAYMNDTGYALQHIVVCMIPLMEDIKDCAVEDEEYKKAFELEKLIAHLREIIDQQSVSQ